MQPVHLPRKPMPYTPVVHRQYRNKPCLFWRHRGQVSYIYAHEHPRWIRDHKKRIPEEEIGAELWRALADLAMVSNNDPERAAIEHEAQTWHRFATTPAAFEGGNHG